MTMKNDYAKAAKLIKQELKKQFPSVKFSVISKGYSGGNHINVNWTNGPTEDVIAKITKKYKYGNFNGMNDLYEYNNVNTELPQAKYIFHKRLNS